MLGKLNAGFYIIKFKIINNHFNLINFNKHILNALFESVYCKLYFSIVDLFTEYINTKPIIFQIFSEFNFNLFFPLLLNMIIIE